MNGRSTAARCIIASVATFGCACAQSAERGLSYYLPGYYGDFYVAVAPRPGTYVYGTNYNFLAQQHVDGFSGALKLQASAAIAGIQYVAPEKFLDATFSVGAYTAFISANLHGVLESSGSTLRIDQQKSEWGDTSLSPVSLYWHAGNWHFNVYESIFVPTGKFVAADALNLSRNYFGFDTTAAITLLCPQSGFEVSVVPGVLFNTENPTSNYRTGSEYHVDVMLNLSVSPQFAIGLHGYTYGQFENDKSNGASVAGSRSSSTAVGPSAVWIPSALGLDGKIVFKWLHDVDAENRFHGDVVSVTGALKF